MTNNKSLMSQVVQTNDFKGSYATGILYSAMNGVSLGATFIVQKISQD